MADFDLEQKFPEMRPVKSVPSLWTVNGCGFSIYGSRDFDEETRTYVKTHCLCVLFVPFLYLGAYRVADAPRGWYFIGRVPLSGLAKMWNCLLFLSILAVAGFVGWETYTHSPDYLARQQLARADALAAEGKLGQAAGIYRDVALGGTGQARPALDKFKELLDGPVAKAPLNEAAAIFRIAVELHERGSNIPDVYERALKLANQHAKTNPSGALQVVDAVAPLAKNANALTKKRQELLERVVKKDSKDVEHATQLALIYEAQDKPSQCEKLLRPLRQRLGIGEGARILGQIYARQGKLEQAHGLLLPYAEGRMKKLHDAEQAFEDTQNRVWQQIVQQLQKKFPPDFPSARYQQAGEAEKKTIVLEYLVAKTKDDPSIKQAREAVAREGKVGPVALDLGIVILRRAQGMADAAARRKELQKAEKVFQAIRNVRPGSDLFLAQVKYWLGKPAEGRKLFNQLLETQHRNPTSLITVSNLLREVGATFEARTLAEEAYTKAKDEKQKFAAARQRSLLRIDLDDEITWLRRSNPSEPEVKAHLSMCLGNKAMREGKDEEAAKHLREGLEIYERLPEAAATLNNRAILYSTLYQATGDSEALDKRTQLLQKAITLKPSDSILLVNAADAVEETAFRDLIGPAIDLKTLKMTGSLNLLYYLPKDQAEKRLLVEKVRNHKGVAKAIRYYHRLQVLSSKSPNVYANLSAIYQYMEDQPALHKLWQQLDKADLDLADSIRETLDGYQGKKDDKHKQEMEAAIQRYKDLVEKTRKEPGGVTFAVAATALIGYRISGEVLGLEVNADEVVRLAEEAHKAAPSTMTHTTLVTALLFRASRALAKQEPAYAKMASKARRSLSAYYLIPLALAQGEPLRQAVLVNKDVQQVLALVLKARQKFPKDNDVWSWAMLRAARPEEAAKIAKVVLADKVGQIKRSIDQKISPVNASTAVRVYWARQIAGQEGKGLDILKRCAARGVPLPFDPK